MMRRLRGRVLTGLASTLVAACVASPTQDPDFDGQHSDEAFEFPDTGAPAFDPGGGPRVGIDGAHHNFHTASGRYRAFAEILRRDGYRVEAFESEFTTDSLHDVDILVISNALSEENETDWSLPNHSAFTPEEIEAVRGWIESGGRLMLIADHMPMPGAAAGLAAALGLRFHDGLALKADGNGYMTFRARDGSLADHAVSQGVPFVTTFSGQAFELESGSEGIPLMRVAEGAYLLFPERSGEFSESTPRIPAGGMLQGALLQRGRGRIAVFGEAAQFTAQVSGAGAQPMGMNHPDAPHNARFLLNVMRWLSRGLEGR